MAGDGEAVKRCANCRYYDPDALGDERGACRRRALAAEAEAERLRGLIERDHTGLAAGLVKALRAVRSWDWLRRIGEWGSYSYEQRTVSTLREEINGCLGEIEAAAEAALRQSGDLSRGVSVTDDDGEAD